MSVHDYKNVPGLLQEAHRHRHRPGTGSGPSQQVVATRSMRAKSMMMRPGGGAENPSLKKRGASVSPNFKECGPASFTHDDSWASCTY